MTLDELIVSRYDYYRLRCKALEDAIDKALTHLDNDKNGSEVYAAIVSLERGLEEGECVSE